MTRFITSLSNCNRTKRKCFGLRPGCLSVFALSLMSFGTKGIVMTPESTLASCFNLWFCINGLRVLGVAYKQVTNEKVLDVLVISIKIASERGKPCLKHLRRFSV